MLKEVYVVLFFSFVSDVFSCCVPNQWEGMQGIAHGFIQAGTPNVMEALYNISFDATNKKFRLSGSMNMDGKPMEEIVLQDYSVMPGKQYAVVGGKCIKSDLSGPFPQKCLTSAAKLKVSSYFGVGMKKIMVNEYSDIIDGEMTDITVTKNSCIPVTTTQKSASSLTFINYMGITPGIKNMSVFDIPKICMNDENSSQVRHQKIRSSAFFHHL